MGVKASGWNDRGYLQAIFAIEGRWSPRGSAAPSAWSAPAEPYSFLNILIGETLGEEDFYCWKDRLAQVCRK
jgi:hypothetical protein